MKRLIRTALLATALFTAAVPAVRAQDDALVYNRRLNRTIGVTPMANAVGSSYSVINANGAVILSGKIGTGSTFFLPTARLKNGAYRFMIGNNNAQSFIIR